MILIISLIHYSYNCIGILLFSFHSDNHDNLLFVGSMVEL